MPDYTRGTRCTVELRSGAFCDAHSAEDVPFPICEDHALQLVRHRPLESWLTITPERLAQMQAAPEPPTFRPSSHEPVVYYADMRGGIIKIGFTTQPIGTRMTQLRAGTLLATEPGDDQLERLRHQQFAHLRIGKREDFRAAPELTSHIDMLVRHHGGIYKQAAA